MDDAYFMAELNERLFTHYTRGAWRAPHSQRLLAVGRNPGQALGKIACADPRDLARALAAFAPATGAPPDTATLLGALQAEAPALERLRVMEGFGDICPAELQPVTLEAPGKLVLLSAAALPLARLVPLLITGAQRGMIWKPAPGAAASAHLLMRHLGPLAAGRLAMVQGDHATGAALATMLPPDARLIWASTSPLPPDLPACTLRISTTDPARP